MPSLTWKKVRAPDTLSDPWKWAADAYGVDLQFLIGKLDKPSKKGKHLLELSFLTGDWEKIGLYTTLKEAKEAAAMLTNVYDPYEDYTSELGWFHVVDEFLSSTLGRDIGGTADWQVSAWKVGDLPGGEGYEGYFVVDTENDDVPEYALFRRHHDLDTDEYVDEEIQTWNLNSPSAFKQFTKEIKRVPSYTSSPTQRPRW